MGFGWVQKNISPIAVDFGAESLKLLQIIPDDPPKLLAAGCIDIPAEARKDAQIHRAFVGNALKELLRDGKFKGRRAVASISASHSHVQHVRIAKADPAMIEQQLELELRGKVPFYPAGMVIRHVMVGEVFADGQSRQEVICFAASRESVLRQVAMAKAAGLDIVGMHCEPMSILASFAHLFRRTDDDKRTTLFLDIGAATTKALVAHGSQLVFAKTIHVGGDHFTRQYAEQMKIDPSAARALRVQQATDQSNGAAAPAEPQPGQVEAPRSGNRSDPAAHPLGAALPHGSTASGTATAAQPSATATLPISDDGEMLETLIDELQLCMGYHASVFQDRAIEKVVFLGGESRQLAMCQQIARALRLPAQLGDPLARLVRTPGSPAPAGVDLRQSQPGWAVPLGLCLLPTNL